MSNFFHRIMAILGLASVVIPQVAPILPGKVATVATSVVGAAILIGTNADKLLGKQP